MRTREIIVPELIHALAVDIGEPLSDVVNRAMSLARHAPWDADPRYWAELGRLEASAARSQAMLDSLCRYLLADALEESVDTVDLELLMHDVLHATRAIRRRHPAHVEATVSGSVFTYGALLRSALTELITNAARWGRSDDDATTISVRLLTSDGTVSLEVTDTGPGIPPDRREAAFALFGSVAPAGNDTLGVGLAVLRRRVEAVGGSLRLLAAGGKTGLRVSLSLPRPASEQAHQTSPDQRSSVGGAA